MIGLFSIFDPISSIVLNNWISLFFPLMVFSLFRTVFVMKSRLEVIVFGIVTQLLTEMKRIIGLKKEQFLLISVSLIFIILMRNVLGIFSFIFTSTGHLRITLSLGLPMWLISILVRLVKNINHFLIHLTPIRTPVVLIFFIVCIETVRLIIRPITLSVRLAANIIAGHLLLTLLGNIYISIRKQIVFFVILRDFILIILESAVAGIQSYVFVILSLLYINESF